MTPEYFDRAAAAEYLTKVRFVKTAKGSLQKLASTGGGPKFRRVAARVLYEKKDLDAWADAKFGPAVSSTAELPRVGRKPRNSAAAPIASAAD